MKNLWYKIIRLYVYLGLQAYFNSIEVSGKENIPKEGATIFVGNHRNGLIDPILIGVTSNRIHYYLTRASAFKNPVAALLLKSINMIPVFRMRDGINSISKNHNTFTTSVKALNKNYSVLIFPEGNHGIPRRLRRLSKGFTRIAFAFLDKYPTEKLFIVPVGINYTNMFKKGSKVSIYYGKPIAVNPLYNASEINASIEKLKEKTAASLQKLSTHIDDLSQHDLIEKQLIESGIDFLNPTEANNLIHTTSNWNKNSNEEKNTHLNRNCCASILKFLFTINTLLPIIVWKFLKPNIKDPALISTSLFGLSLGLIPFCYLIKSIVLGYFTTPFWGVIYFIMSVLLVYLYSKSIQITNFTTNPS